MVIKTEKGGFQMEKKAFTTILPDELIGRIRDLSWWSRMSITELTTKAISKYIEEWENANGPIPPKENKPKLQFAAATAGGSNNKEGSSD